MEKLLRGAALGLLLGVMAVACAKVPYTGRTQYNLVPDAIMKGLGKTSYTDMLGGLNVQRRGSDAQVLERVGGRISAVANRPDYDWQFSLIEDSTINAWCLPGGYIGFYTGILPVLRNEAGMAFVMGHEVGHAIARHGAERLSQQLTLFGGITGLELYLSKKSELKPAQRAALLGALGLGTEVGVLLPFSRKHESEADVLGLMYMAEAGYPPAESIEVWDRMAALTGGGGGPAFLRTHPTHEARKSNLREWLPRARKKYQRNAISRDTREALWGDAAPASPGAARKRGG